MRAFEKGCFLRHNQQSHPILRKKSDGATCPAPFLCHSPTGSEYDADQVKQIASKLWNDESGAELVEYVMIMGLVLVTCLFVIVKVGGKLEADWATIRKLLE